MVKNIGFLHNMLPPQLCVTGPRWVKILYPVTIPVTVGLDQLWWTAQSPEEDFTDVGHGNNHVTWTPHCWYPSGKWNEYELRNNAEHTMLSFQTYFAPSMKSGRGLSKTMAEWLTIWWRGTTTNHDVQDITTRGKAPAPTIPTPTPTPNYRHISLISAKSKFMQQLMPGEIVKHGEKETISSATNNMASSQYGPVQHTFDQL